MREVTPQAESPFDIPVWVRLLDTAAEGLVYAILLGGFVSTGYATNMTARTLAFGACALLGLWAAAGIVLGRWSGPAMRTPRRVALVMVAMVACSAVHLVPLPTGVVESLSPAWRASIETMASVGIEAPDRVPLAQHPVRALASWHQLVASTCFFACALLLATRRRRAKRLLAAIAIAVIAEGIFGLANYILTGAFRSSGALYNPSHHAAFIAMGLPILLATLWTRTPEANGLRGFLAVADNVTLIGWTLTLLTVISWLASLSRGAIAIGGVVLLVWIALELLEANPPDEPQARRRALVLCGGFAFILVVTLALVGFARGMLYRTDSLVPTTGLPRLELARATTEALLESPLVGLGLGGTENALTRFVRVPLPTRPIWTHSDWVQLPAELGIPLSLVVIAVAAWAVTGFVAEFRYRRRAYSSLQRLFGRAALTGALIAGLHAGAEFHLRIPLVGFLFLLLLALVSSPGTLFIFRRPGPDPDSPASTPGGAA